MAARAGRAPLPPEHEKEPSGAETQFPDNLSDREKRAAARLRHIAEIRKARDDRMAAQAVVKAKRKLETRLRNAYKSDGFTLEILDEALKREETPRRDLVRYEAERNEVFEDLGQAVFVQPEMFAEMTDEQSWADHGFQAGLAGKLASPPKECPPEFHQAWMKRWGAGQERIAWSLASRGINPERGTGSGTGPTADEIAREPEPA
jgi:hypothetical protein